MTAVLESIDLNSPSKGTLECVDAFRGLILTPLLVGPSLIVTVGNVPPGWFHQAVNRELHPSIWNGLTLVDFGRAACVMAVGLGISLQAQAPRQNVYCRDPDRLVFGRFLLVFILGLICNGLFLDQWSDLRITGFLQRVAICYLVGSILFVHVSKSIRYGTLTAILVGYWLLMAAVPGSGNAAGDFSFDGNLAAWVDQRFLPGSALYGKWDPDGILTTIPAIGSCLFGMLCGDILLSKMRPNDKVLWFLFGGLVSINLGFLMDLVFPINRSLWSSSYVLASGGIGSMVLGLCYLFVDVLSLGRYLFPFVVMGRNFLIALIIIEMMPRVWPVQRLLGDNSAIAPSPFAQAVTESLLVWLLIYGVYQVRAAIESSSHLPRNVASGELFDG